jgi:hypothetical protein
VGVLLKAAQPLAHLSRAAGLDQAHLIGVAEPEAKLQRVPVTGWIWVG